MTRLPRIADAVLGILVLLCVPVLLVLWIVGGWEDRKRGKVERMREAGL